VIFDKLFKPSSVQTKYTSFLNNTSPLFSQFGRNIYTSDVVQMCIDCIAQECSKLQPRHIRRTSDGPVTIDDSLNKLFKFAPNPLMTTRDFLEKVVWNLFLNYNSFIYPVNEPIKDARGNWNNNYTAFYPLNPTLVEFLQDAAGKLYVKFTFQSGYQSPAIPYSDIIHLRKKFSCNDIMGGGMNGQPDNAALLKTLEINDTVLQGIGKAVKASLAVRGIVKYNTVLDDGKQAAEIKSFETKMANSADGILPMDLSAEFTPITMNPATISKDVMDFLENKVLRWFGVSLPILTKDYTDNQKQSFYDGTVEPVVIGLTQAFTKAIFTPTEISYGNEIDFFYQNLEMMSVESKKSIADTLGNRGALTNNFLLGMFGIEPYDGGNVRIANLNYINANLADAYQLARAGIDAQTPVTNKKGDTTDGKTE
jgi:HK97 family phage portal protein